MSAEQWQLLDATLRDGQIDLQADVETLRAGFEEVMAGIPLAEDVKQQTVILGGVSAVEVTIADGDSEKVILYFHGGVYVIGSAASSVPLVSDVARHVGARAFTLDYRLAPEHPFPAAVEDAQDAYQGLLEQGIRPEQIALAGESAGGGLAVALLVALRDSGAPLPSSAYLMSPYADLTLSGDSMVTKEALDSTLSPDALGLRIPDYVDSADPKDPLISPVFADLSGLPPLLIQSGSHEILLSDALRLAEHAALADVEISLDVVPGAPHVFQAFAAMVDGASAALERASLFLNGHYAAGAAA
jgi:epsilon-lactone hydrolase